MGQVSSLATDRRVRGFLVTVGVVAAVRFRELPNERWSTYQSRSSFSSTVSLLAFLGASPRQLRLSLASLTKISGHSTGTCKFSSTSSSYLRTLQSPGVCFLNHLLVLRPFSRRTHANYARLVTFFPGFGFQKAFYRGFEANHEVSTKARNLL